MYARTTNFRYKWQAVLAIIILTGIFSSCIPEQNTLTESATLTPTVLVEETPIADLTPTPRPTSTPTPSPIGTEGNPIKIGFILNGENQQSQDAAEDIAYKISTLTGYAVESFFYPDFETLSSAILNLELDLFWLKPIEYLFLNLEGAAQVMLVTNHLGVFAYGVQFMANQERGFLPYFDPESGETFGDPLQALQQFSGTRPCLIEPNALPGHLVPLGLLFNASTPTLDPVFTYSYNAMVRALYIQGICDFGVSYALIGDPLSSSDILNNIPEAQDDLVVIWQTEGIIPNINLSVSPALPAHIRFRLKEAFLNFGTDSTGLGMMSTALHSDVDALLAVEDHFYNPLRSAIFPMEPDFQKILFQTSQ